MTSIQFGIVGTGWRAEFYLRVARACPDHFKVVGLVSRGNPAIEARFGVKTYPSIDDLLRHTSPSFVVTSVPWSVNPDTVKALVAKGMPVLTETPPAPDLDAMTDLVRTVRRRKGLVQVAEQVHLRPHHQAQIRLARAGRLGAVHEAYVSAAHGYHGISVMRRLLGIGFENAEIGGFTFTAPILKGPNRNGPPLKNELVPVARDVCHFRFGDKLGILDFTGPQYFGFIRNEHLQVRGTHGELVNNRLTCLKDFKSPVLLTLDRIDTGARGDLNAPRLTGYQAGGEWLYRNPFPASGLMDDELAIAELLTRMDACVRTGQDAYSLAEGCQDHYLYLSAQHACKTGKDVKTTTRIWGKI